MRPLDLELRKRIVKAYEQAGYTQRELAVLFGVSERSVRRLWRKWCEQGDVTPEQVGGYRPPAIQGEALNRLKQTLRKRPDATLEELRVACGVDCSIVTVHNTLKRVGYRRKKKRCAPVNRTGATCGQNEDGGVGVHATFQSNAWCSWTKVGPRPT